MEIIYDRHRSAALCRELSLNMIRARTAGTHPAFIEMIRELIGERMQPTRRADHWKPWTALTFAGRTAVRR